MYNYSTSLIGLRLEENGNIVYQGTVPYALLDHVVSILTPSADHNKSRKLYCNIEGDQYTYLEGEYSRVTEGTDDLNHISNVRYIGLHDAKTLYDTGLQDASALEIQNQEFATERSIFEASERQRLAEEAINSYQELLVEQKQRTDAQTLSVQAEQLRQDENRIAIVRGVAFDPTTAPDALQSEFGQTGDVRRQIAAVMERNTAISKLVIRTNPMYWLPSYEIMSVLGMQSSEDKELAQLLVDQLPDDSNLKTMLKNFGWAN